MSKLNYTKVEKLLIHAIQKMRVQGLLELANRLMEEKHLNIKKGATKALPKPATLKLVVENIKNDLKKIKELDKDVYLGLAAEQGEVDEVVSDLHTFVLSDWENLLALKEKILQTKEQLMADPDADPLEEQIEREKKELEKRGEDDFKRRKGWQSV